MTHKTKPPTPVEQFQDETSVMPEVIAQTVLMDERRVWYDLSEQDREWFLNHVSRRLRHMDANVDTFHAKLRTGDNWGRDACYMWVRHWADAYIDGPADYKKKHPLNLNGIPATNEAQTLGPD